MSPLSWVKKAFIDDEEIQELLKGLGVRRLSRTACSDDGGDSLHFTGVYTSAIGGL